MNKSGTFCVWTILNLYVSFPHWKGKMPLEQQYGMKSLVWVSSHIFSVQAINALTYSYSSNEKSTYLVVSMLDTSQLLGNIGKFLYWGYQVVKNFFIFIMLSLENQNLCPNRVMHMLMKQVWAVWVGEWRVTYCDSSNHYVLLESHVLVQYYRSFWPLKRR